MGKKHTCREDIYKKETYIEGYIWGRYIRRGDITK